MDNKRFYRELKRDIKKKGNRKRRNFFKRSLYKNPTESHLDEYFLGKDSSSWLNGIDENQYTKDKNDRMD